MKKNKKRKGFTLIELIAVIAILGILALIIVPRVAGYTKTAKDNAIKANCKVIVNAVETYNADVDSKGSGIAIKSDTTLNGDDNNTVESLLTKGTDVYINSWPSPENLPKDASTYGDILKELKMTTK